MEILYKITSLIVSLLFVHSGLNAEPENLSINLMWLNANKTQSITDGVRPDPKQVVKSWFLKHPENNTVVNFWYDGSKIGLDKATIVEQEKNAFLNVLSDDEKQRFNLRDMQDLDLVKDNADLFAATPVYFQSDLLRFFLAKELIDRGESDTVLYADLNVQPEDREYLFDAQTLRFLDEYGFVNLRHRASENLIGGYKGFENKLLIMQKNNYLWEAFDIALVAPLRKGIEKYSGYLDKMTQKVYGQIEVLFGYVLSLKNLLILEDEEYFLMKNINMTSGGDITDKRTGKKISMDGLNKVTVNYYYTDDDLEELLKHRIAGLDVDLKDFEIHIKEIEARLKSLEKKPASDKNEKKITKWKDQLAKYKSRIKERQEKREHWSSEVEKKDRIEEIKTEIREKLEKSNWPKDLPVPAKRMVAPPSHFG